MSERFSLGFLSDFRVEPLGWKVAGRRPTPPPGFFPFKYRSGPCPNCGVEEYGSLGVGGGFQERRVQNVWRALKRLIDKSRLNSYTALCANVGSEEEPCMLKSHPSRYGTGKLTCCDTELWHDFFGNDWAYYYRPKAQKTLDEFE